MKKSKQVLKTDGRTELYMAETQQYIEVLKHNLIKKILIRQQSKTINESKIAGLTSHSLN